MSRISIVTLGTEGDVRPCVALGAGLAAAGHDVRVATNAAFADLVTGRGLRFCRLSGDLGGLLAGEHPDIAESGARPGAMFRALSRLLASLAEPWADEGRDACAGADLVLAAGAGVYLGTSVAEALGIPFVQAYTAPGALVGGLPMGFGAGDAAARHVMAFLLWSGTRRAVNEVVRPALGLRPYPWIGPQYGLRRAGRPVLFAFSPHVVKHRTPPEHATVTGYWYLDRPGSWQPPPGLERFLAGGPPPLYVGFGSMATRDAAAITEVVMEALRATRRRAVLALGRGGLSDAVASDGDRVFWIGHVPHDWLLPRVELAVHHAGAGTTAAVVRAGIPSVPVPFMGDQNLWGPLLARQGVASPSLPRRRLTVQRLAAAIDQASDPAVRARAARLGERVRAEDGVASAVDALRRRRLLE